jgi:hypothetical protein
VDERKASEILSAIKKIVVGSTQNFVTLELPLLLDNQPHLDNHRQHKYT